MNFEANNPYFQHRQQVFQALTQAYDIQTALYPGSYVDASPSLYIPHVTYVDMDKRAAAFFTNKVDKDGYITKSRTYSQPVQMRFLHTDYTQLPDNVLEPVDLLISLYAGFVSLHTGHFLRPGGLLLAGDSHGDATLAHFDPRFQLIGVLAYRRGKFVIVKEDLDTYFRYKSGKEVDLEKVRKTMKGPKYARRVEYYLFKKCEEGKPCGKN